MPEIAADPTSLSCYHLFPGPRIQGSQWLAPDLFSWRAASFEESRSGKSGGSAPLPIRELAADSLQIGQK